MEIRLEHVREALRLDPFDEEAARERLAHAHRRDYPVPDYRDSAVLVLVYPGPEGLHLLLTRRTDRVEHHRGQISFPGGARENGETLEETALREAGEEVALRPGGVEILGRLRPLEIPVSGYLVHPFVAHARARPDFRPDPTEVSEILEPPLDLFLDEGRRRETEIVIHGTPRRVPIYDLPGVEEPPLWGATAIMLSGLVERLKRVVQRTSSRASPEEPSDPAG
jgi:8-oxo-dGTP pyrophosphatase MutT (NUDIX family)